MRDRFGRNLTYLRVSVTDRCNMRCIYCMPEGGAPLVSHSDLLSYEEIVRVVRAGVSCGVQTVRLTGGEPLMRRGIVDLVARLAEIRGLEDLAMTTNASGLEDLAPVLKAAGLKRVNISLDSLDPATFATITRGGNLAEVLRGIDAALEHGLTPVKLNCVPLRGLNDGEIPAMLEFIKNRPVHLRFIELMPVGWNDAWFNQRFIPASELRARVEAVASGSGGRVLPATVLAGRGPASYLGIEGYRGKVGFISPMTAHFCSRCTRMRLTSLGKISPCLASGAEIDVKAEIRAGCTDERIAELFGEAAMMKPLEHSMECAAGLDARLMSRIGG
ncbi:MAG: GTP 3',8-cyclase MoaA [Firmicutes bacterium]|nr:GTP 3',8-cyclase MoaA [Bacillota bacterium]